MSFDGTPDGPASDVLLAAADFTQVYMNVECSTWYDMRT